MRAAEGSGKTAIEYEQNVGFVFKTGQVYFLSLKIIQGKIGGGGINFNSWHQIFLFTSFLSSNFEASSSIAQMLAGGTSS
jgi:hypothetical protein